MILTVEKSVTQTGLWAAVGLALVSLGVGKYASMSANFFVVKAFAFFIFLIILGFTVLLLQYVARLHFTHRNRLELNEEGLYDFASICELNFVPMKCISQIRFDQIWGQSFLVVSFHANENPLMTKNGIVLEVYRLIFGFDLWVPLGFFKVSKVDLESQLIHLDHIIEKRRDKVSSPRAEVNLTPSKKENTPLPLNPLSVLSGVNVPHAPASIRPPPPPPRGLPQTPPPIELVSPEKHRILAQVEKIRAEVRATKFDQTICELYLDHISVFGALAASQSELLPDGVMAVAVAPQNPDYEETTLQFKATQFTFGLRKDIGKSDEALLSVGVMGRVHCTLRVRVEIGELSPIEIESFIPGEWQLAVYDLISSIQAKNEQKLGISSEGGTQSEISFQTKTNIEDLKSRFGIKE